jgi:hypothetical protein
MKKEKFNSKFWEVCGDDELRPNLRCVYFSNGRLYATDGSIVLLQKTDLHNFSPEDIENLEGRMVHKEVFKSISALKIEYPEKIKFLADAIEVTGDSGKIYYSYFATEPYNIEDIIENYKLKETSPITRICLNSDYIKKLSSAMISTYMIFYFKGESNLIKVLCEDYSEYEQCAYFMPRKVEK